MDTNKHTLPKYIGTMHMYCEPKKQQPRHRFNSKQRAEQHIMKRVRVVFEALAVLVFGSCARVSLPENTRLIEAVRQEERRRNVGLKNVATGIN